MSKDKSKGEEKTRTFYEGKRQNPSPLYVSLDNADTVIEGAPPLSPFFGDRLGSSGVGMSWDAAR